MSFPAMPTQGACPDTVQAGLGGVTPAGLVLRMRLQPMTKWLMSRTLKSNSVIVLAIAQFQQGIQLPVAINVPDAPVFERDAVVQPNAVGALEVEDRVVARACAEDKEVAAVTTRQGIIARTAVKRIAAIAAAQRIGAARSLEQVRTIPTAQQVVAITAAQRVAPVAAGELVRAKATIKQVGTIAAAHRVGAAAAQQRVVAVAAEDHVGARAPFQQVAPPAAAELQSAERDLHQQRIVVARLVGEFGVDVHRVEQAVRYEIAADQDMVE